MDDRIRFTDWGDPHPLPKLIGLCPTCGTACDNICLKAQRMHDANAAFQARLARRTPHPPPPKPER